MRHTSPVRHIVVRHGLRLWTESFGRPDDPAVLLIPGATAQAVFWPDTFCARLAATGHRVVRYDQRDTGKSSTVDFARHPYDLADLADDAADVLAGLGVGAAHVAGASAGGMVAQLLALRTPAVVRSLLLICSSPDANGDVFTPPASGLPLPAAPMLEHVRALAARPPASPAEELAADVDGWRVLVGPDAPFDEPYWLGLVRRMRRRARRPATAGHHLSALDRTPSLLARLPEIKVRTSIVHGLSDDVLPIAHGRALAAGIDGSVLIEMAGLGHTFPPEWMPRLHDIAAQHLTVPSTVDPRTATSALLA